MSESNFSVIVMKAEGKEQAKRWAIANMSPERRAESEFVDVVRSGKMYLVNFKKRKIKKGVQP